MQCHWFSFWCHVFNLFTLHPAFWIILGRRDYLKPPEEDISGRTFRYILQMVIITAIAIVRRNHCDRKVDKVIMARVHCPAVLWWQIYPGEATNELYHHPPRYCESGPGILLLTDSPPPLPFDAIKILVTGKFLDPRDNLRWPHLVWHRTEELLSSNCDSIGINNYMVEYKF